MKALNFQKRYELLLLIASTPLLHMGVVLQFLNVPIRFVLKVICIAQMTGLHDVKFNVCSFISKSFPW